MKRVLFLFSMVLMMIQCKIINRPQTFEEPKTEPE